MKTDLSFLFILLTALTISGCSTAQPGNNAVLETDIKRAELYSYYFADNELPDVKAAVSDLTVYETNEIMLDIDNEEWSLKINGIALYRRLFSTNGWVIADEHMNIFRDSEKLNALLIKTMEQKLPANGHTDKTLENSPYNIIKIDNVFARPNTLTVKCEIADNKLARGLYIGSAVIKGSSGEYDLIVDSLGGYLYFYVKNAQGLPPGRYSLILNGLKAKDFEVRSVPDLPDIRCRTTMTKTTKELSVYPDRDIWAYISFYRKSGANWVFAGYEPESMSGRKVRDGVNIRTNTYGEFKIIDMFENEDIHLYLRQQYNRITRLSDESIEYYKRHGLIYENGMTFEEFCKQMREDEVIRDGDDVLTVIDIETNSGHEYRLIQRLKYTDD